MDFTQLVATCGSWAVLEFVAIQCAGIAFPGGAVLLAAAVYAGTNHQVALAPIILAAAVGSILGNLLGYVLGSRGGYAFLARHGHFLRLDERKLKLGDGYRVWGLCAGRFISSTNWPAGHRACGAGPLSVCHLYRHLTAQSQAVRRPGSANASRSSCSGCGEKEAACSTRFLKRCQLSGTNVRSCVAAACNFDWRV